MKKIKVGISSCLLGQKVRHDGGHKRNVFVMDTLSEYFEYSAFCPEVAAGLSVPRPTLRLTRQESVVRMVGSKDTTLDVTDQMLETANKAVKYFGELSGYILKKDSPSCGMERVRIYSGNGQPERNGQGLFASVLMEQYPNLPVEEEGRLMDPVLRENFIERVFIYHRWQQLVHDGLTVSGLINFHSQHKLNLLAHSEVILRNLGKLVANTREDNIEQTATTYISELMQALRLPANRKRHTNVLMHVMGYLKKTLSSSEKQELSEILTNYRQGFIPLVVPITLLNHHLRRTPVSYIENQYYMNPYPMQLMLRNKL